MEWTAKAWEAIKSKAYRYFSPEFDDEWSDPKTGENTAISTSFRVVALPAYTFQMTDKPQD